MTTIACDGKSMGSDGRCTSGDTIIENDQQKIFRLNDGRIVGFAGNTYNFNEVLDFFDGNSEWPELHGEMSVLLLDKDGSIFLMDPHGRETKRTAPVAIGSGWTYAMTAMKCGKSVEEAIRMACELDVFSGGTIRVLSL